MALRVSITREELHEELQKKGFQETAERTLKHTVWLTPQGEPISVPDHAEVPEWLLINFLEKANKLYDRECIEQREYEIKLKDAEAVNAKVLPMRTGTKD